MKIEIKNLEVDIYAPYRQYKYKADLFINDERVCEVSSDGSRIGKAHYTNLATGAREKLVAANVECKKIQSKTLTNEMNMMYELRSNLATFVEDLIIKTIDPHKIERDRHALENLIKKGVVYGYPDQPLETYRSIYLQENTLLQALAGPAREEIGDWCRTILRANFKPGMVIFNKGISQDDAELLGIAHLPKASIAKKQGRVIKEDSAENKKGLRQF